MCIELLYFISELNIIYSSFGYNDIKIDLSKDISEQNLATIYVDITENKITKIKAIKFSHKLLTSPKWKWVKNL